MKGLLISAPLVVLVACATSSSSTPDAAPAAIDGAVAPDASSADAGLAAACDDGQLAVSISGGELRCASVDEATATAVRARCSIYLGARDSCDGCVDPPTKWGRSSTLDCSPGVGAGNACVASTLDEPSVPVELASVDLDGNVNGDDKIYAGLHCVAAPRAPVPAPCAAGWAISGRSGDTWTCTPISEAAIAYVGGHCAVHLGWRDSCDGCATAPLKWGSTNDTACVNGAGADNTCVQTTLDGQTVNLFGLSTDGDVNGDDKFYLGLACAEGTGGTTHATSECPDGQFVVATNVDGSFSCGDPAAAFATYVADRCSLFLGWHDSCDACTQPPTKWGKVGTASCFNGSGTDATCADFSLGGVTLPMFGLSTDGDVNGDDSFYVGLRCAP